MSCYVILAIILVISAAEKAGIVCVRTLPSPPMLRLSAVTVAASGASSVTTMSYSAQGPRQYVLDGRAMFLRHVLEGLGALDQVLRVAHALVREARKRDVGRHRFLPNELMIFSCENTPC